MATNSVTGRFRDIEISFTVDGTRVIMSVQNLLSEERSVRVMYKRLSVSGLANWTRFQLSDKSLSFRVPTEVMEAYRLTFFVDDADPVSTPQEKVLEELEPLMSESSTQDSPEASVPTPATETEAPSNQNGSPAPEAATQLAQAEVTSSAETSRKEEPQPAQKAQPTVPPQGDPVLEEARAPESTPPNRPLQLAAPGCDFKITVPFPPQSATTAQRLAKQESANEGRSKQKAKEKGIFGHLAQAFGLSAGGRRSKAYYQQQGESIQNEFQDRLAKLETDYNEGCGLSLVNWKQENLSEAETAIFLLNLMENEIVAWRKEAGRATSEKQLLVDTLAEVDVILKQTLKQARGVSTPSPTLFPNLLAENQRDLEKIRSECDAYLRRFSVKFTVLEKQHAAKIEILPFQKFLTKFVRDLLFVNVGKSTQPNALPPQLNWFLALINSEVMPIEVGKTKVSARHHELEGTTVSDFESGTIAEVLTPGLQSTNGKRVYQRAVVIQAE